MYFPYYIVYMVIGFVITLVVFFWAVNQGQFKDQNRARFIPLEAEVSTKPIKGTRRRLSPTDAESVETNARYFRELLESGELRSQSQVLPLPQTVREAVLRRADRLATLVRQVVDMAAVFSPLLEVPLLDQATGRSELEVVEAVDELVRRQFLIPEDGRFRFQHFLTREAIYGAIGDWRLRILHRRAAHAL